MTVKLFKEHTREEHADSLAAYLPDNDLFLGKFRDSAKLRQLLLGLAESLRISENTMERVWEQYDINETVDLIDQWESALGIPDQCFFGERTIEVRRRDVLIKLTSSIQTAQDFEDLAALLGVTVVVQSAAETSTFPFTWPIVFNTDTGQDQRFTLLVISIVDVPLAFPLEFPILFPDTGLILVKCLFQLLKPVNVDIIYRQA